MLFGFTDQDALRRVMSDARSLYRRASPSLPFNKCQAGPIHPGSHYAAIWLSRGGLRLAHLPFGGDQAVTPRTGVSARRCLVPSVDEEGLGFLAAGMLTQSQYALDPEMFRLVRVQGVCVPVTLPNWDNWLNPERDVRPMLWPSEELVVPGC